MTDKRDAIMRGIVFDAGAARLEAAGVTLRAIGEMLASLYTLAEAIRMGARADGIIHAEVMTRDRWDKLDGALRAYGAMRQMERGLLSAEAQLTRPEDDAPEEDPRE